MALLNTIDELRRYVKIESTDFPEAIALALPEIEKGLVVYLGKDLYKFLSEQYEAGIAADTLEDELLRHVQAPLALIATAWGSTEHQVLIDNTGVHIESTGTHKTAFQWQVEDVREYLLTRGYNAVAALLDWLEEHRDESTELKAWAESEAGLRHRQGLFTSVAEFQEYYNINSSYTTYKALERTRRNIENFDLAPVLSDVFLEELREQVRTRNLTSENKNLLRSYVFPALAELTLARGIGDVALRITGDGIELMVARIDKTNAKEADASLTQLLESKKSDALLDGMRYLRRLTDFLDRNASATRFATYFASPAYTAPGTVAPPTNTAETRVYRFAN